MHIFSIEMWFTLTIVIFHASNLYNFSTINYDFFSQISLLHLEQDTDVCRSSFLKKNFSTCARSLRKFSCCIFPSSTPIDLFTPTLYSLARSMNVKCIIGWPFINVKTKFFRKVLLFMFIQYSSEFMHFSGYFLLQCTAFYSDFTPFY